MLAKRHSGRFNTGHTSCADQPIGHEATGGDWDQMQIATATANERSYRRGSATRVLRRDCQAGAVRNSRDKLFQVHDEITGLHRSSSLVVQRPTLIRAKRLHKPRLMCCNAAYLASAACLAGARHVACADGAQPARGDTRESS